MTSYIYKSCNGKDFLLTDHQLVIDSLLNNTSWNKICVFGKVFIFIYDPDNTQKTVPNDILEIAQKYSLQKIDV